MHVGACVLMWFKPWHSNTWNFSNNNYHMVMVSMNKGLHIKSKRRGGEGVRVGKTNSKGNGCTRSGYILGLGPHACKE